MTTGKIVLSIAAGVAAGAILGVIFAPDKGSATRKKIAQKRDDVVDSVHELLDTVTNKLESAKKQAAKMVENGAAKLEALEAEFGAAAKAKLQ